MNSHTSLLQIHPWDRTLNNTQILLILNGAYIRMMEETILRYNAPLYGRRTLNTCWNISSSWTLNSSSHPIRQKTVYEPMLCMGRHHQPRKRIDYFFREHPTDRGDEPKFPIY